MKIRSIKKRQTTQSESPFWISFADLMSALMILFLVVMAVSLMAVTKDINEEAAAETQRAQEILNICHEIKSMANVKNQLIQVDCLDNRINFGEAGRFNFNDYKIQEDGTRALQDIVPIVLEVAKSEAGKKWFKQVVIEGFTDTDGSYLYNLHLSLQRSEWVMCSLLDEKYSRSMVVSDEDKELVKQIFLAGGVSFNNAKESKEASRRVELRLQFYNLDDVTENNHSVIANKASQDETCQI